MTDTEGSAFREEMSFSPSNPSALPVSPKGSGSARPRRGGRLLLLSALVGALVGAAAFFKVRYLPDDVVLPGVTIDAVAVPPGASQREVEALISARAQALGERKIVLYIENPERPLVEVMLAELGVRLDVEQAVGAALQQGKEGDLFERARVAARAREGGINIPLLVKVDRAVAMAKLATLKQQFDLEPVAARLDLDRHEAIAERPGRQVDASETLAVIESLSRAPRLPESLKLAVTTVAPPVTSSLSKGIDISTVVAEYETTFSRAGDQKLRGKNIDNAAKKLDGVVLSPGETFSFNAVVGERSETNGFQKSWEIFKGELVEGIGGGTCQVASTFHAATIFAGLEILERVPHSRPSAYIPMGLDSTVVYPDVDLKVRNPHAFPIVVHTKVEGTKLKIELLGKMRPLKVSFGREVLAKLPYPRKVEEDSELRGKKVVVKQHGIRGYRIKVSRLLSYSDGTSRHETRTDTYPPTTEIYRVPVGFDASHLPPLPDDEQADAKPMAQSAPASAPPSGESDVEFVEAQGAHAPTAAQRDPATSLWLRR